MKVAIVCGAPSSEFLAPFDDNEWEIWVLGNRLHRFTEKGLRVTRVFEVHNNLDEHGDIKKYIEYILNHGLPTIIGETWPQHIGETKVYPYKEVEELYGHLYLTSSPAYMMAYAILEGATEIGLYGVDLSISDHEYFWQRPCVEAWIGFAKGRGIKVTIPDVSHVGKSDYVEGRDWGNDKDVGIFSEDGFLMMAEKHAAKMAMVQKQRQELALDAAANDGAQQVYRNLAKIARALEAQIKINSLDETTLLT